MRLSSQSRRSFVRTAIAGLVLGGLGVTANLPARAAAGPSAEVMVLLATRADGGGSVDPRIGQLPQLSRPPFNAFNTFKLLDKKRLPVEKERPVAYPLPNGRTLQLTLLDVTQDRRFHVRAEINQPDGKAFLKLLEVTAAPNEPFFVGGQSHAGGTLVVGVTMKP